MKARYKFNCPNCRQSIDVEVTDPLMPARGALPPDHIVAEQLGEHWTDATLRQPEPGVRVFAYCPNATMPYKVAIYNEHDGKDYWGNWTGSRFGVSHWMPLPKAPAKVEHQ